MSWIMKDGHVIPGGYKVVCWDLDSSVRSTMHRRHLIPQVKAGRATWEDYSLLAGDDEPIPGAVTLMRMLSHRYLNFAVSGTADTSLELNQKWCQQHDVPLRDFILRPATQDIENGKWKVSAIEALQAAGLKVELFVEDWEPTARYIRENTSVPVLGVNPFDPDAVMVTQRELAEVMEREFTDSSYVGGAELAVNVFSVLRSRTGWTL